MLGWGNGRVLLWICGESGELDGLGGKLDFGLFWLEFGREGLVVFDLLEGDLVVGWVGLLIWWQGNMVVLQSVC